MLKLGKHSLDTRVQHYLWGEGRGWACVNWKTPRNASVPRRLSMIVARGWEVASCDESPFSLTCVWCIHSFFIATVMPPNIWCPVFFTWFSDRIQAELSTTEIPSPPKQERLPGNELQLYWIQQRADWLHGWSERRKWSGVERFRQGQPWCYWGR